MRRESEKYTPTPEQIARACRQIRSQWSPRERRKRAAWQKRRRWVLPEVHESALSPHDTSGDDWRAELLRGFV